MYIVECKDGKYYTGMTWNISNRMAQHASTLGSKYTRRHGFRRLVYQEEHEDLETARVRERQIKDWSRAKKERLIRGEWKRDW